MANTIRIKRSTGSSAPGSLENAELAFAEGSKMVFVGIGTGGSGGSATTIEPNLVVLVVLPIYLQLELYKIHF